MAGQFVSIWRKVYHQRVHVCVNALYKYPDVCRDKKYNMSDSGGLRWQNVKRKRDK